MRTDDELVAFAAGTFHATLFITLLALALHRLGSAQDVLGNLGTLTGFALFLALWAASWWATRRALREEGDATPAVLLARAVVWGAATGVLFLAALVLFVIVPLLPGAPLHELWVVVIPLIFATAFAVVIGALVGSLLALVDLALAWVARCASGPRHG